MRRLRQPCHARRRRRIADLNWGGLCGRSLRFNLFLFRYIRRSSGSNLYALYFLLQPFHPEQKNRMRDALRSVTGRTFRLGPYKAPAHEEADDDPLEKLTEMAKKLDIPVTEND